MSRNKAQKGNSNQILIWLSSIPMALCINLNVIRHAGYGLIVQLKLPQGIKNIDSIMSSIDGIKRAEAPPFLYAKILAGYNTPEPGVLKYISNLISRPVIVVLFLILTLFADIFVYASAIKYVPEDSGIVDEDYLLQARFADILLYGITDFEYEYVY
ncbi:MAG: hypothetical protein IPP73_17485 [Chitinophagaceae bacterium]|nr:hypothetical protein [Chitinophagaceae bacterium]